MFKFSRVFVLSFIVFVSSSDWAHASVETLSTHTDTFVNSNCALNQTCDLKKASLTQEVFRVRFVGKESEPAALGSRMAMNYETDSVSNLEKYGVVQFIKGCQFTSRLENGVVKRRQDIAYERDGKYPPYVFPNWEIDGFVDDPIEWGDTKSDGSRHNFYWNHEPSHNRPSVKWDYFGFKKPSTPELWLRDGAVIAAYSPESGDARNVSLEMKTCIYKTSDVPRSVPYDQVDFATPIYCFNWTKSVIFNFKTMQYDSPEGIDPFCESFDESSGVTVKK